MTIKVVSEYLGEFISPVAREIPNLCIYIQRDRQTDRQTETERKSVGAERERKRRRESFLMNAVVFQNVCNIGLTKMVTFNSVLMQQHSATE